MATLEEGTIFLKKKKKKLMTREDDPYKILQRLGDNAYKTEFSGDMNISSTFNVGDLAPYIEDEDERIEDLRENSLQMGEVDVKQVTQSNLLNHIKALVRIWPMVTYKHGTQGLGPSKSLLTWDP